jgi:hypothetical protein
MASSINASTSGAGGVITTADNTGNLELQSGGTTIATISSTGLALNTGNITLPSSAAPAFRAYLASNQSISAATGTKLNFDTEMWDTNSNYDTTNKRFTPTVAGYYQVNIGFFGGNSTDAIAILYKNGNETGTATGYATAVNARPRFTGITYFNGTTDYVEAYAYSQGAVTIQGGSSSYTEFSAALIRSA